MLPQLGNDAFDFGYFMTRDWYESVPCSITDRRNAMLNALANFQIIRRYGSVTLFEPNEIAAAMAKAFHDVHSTGRGQLASASHRPVAFTWPTSCHFWVHERPVQFRRMGGCRRRRLNGAVSQGFFSPEKLNLRNAP